MILDVLRGIGKATYVEAQWAHTSLDVTRLITLQEIFCIKVSVASS